jgi:hypothetical protein
MASSSWLDEIDEIDELTAELGDAEREIAFLRNALDEQTRYSRYLEEQLLGTMPHLLTMLNDRAT